MCRAFLLVWGIVLVPPYCVYADDALSPCDDPNYLLLKNKRVVEMTDGEFEYYARKDTECWEYQKDQARPGSDPHSEVEARRPPARASAKWPLLHGFGQAGYGTVSMDDANALIDHNGRSRGRNFDRFAGAFTFGGGVSYLGTRFGVGADVTYEESSVNNMVDDSSGSFGQELTLRVFEVASTVELRAGEQVVVGIKGGVGFGKLVEDFYTVIVGDPSNSRTSSEEATGSGPTIGGYLATKFGIGARDLLIIKGGYHYRNLGRFTTSDGGVVVGVDGAPLDVDVSGAYVTIGLGFTGGRRE